MKEDAAWLRVLGRRLHVRRVPLEANQWLMRHWCRDERPGAPSSCEIRLEWMDPAPPPLEGDVVHVALPAGVQTWQVSGSTWEWRSGGSGVRLTIDAAGSDIQAWGRTTGNHELFEALYVSLCEAMRASGLIALHAAAAIPPAMTRPATSRQAILLPGRTGSGKSTTLLRLADASWVPLAEDLCWLDPATNELVGWDRGVRVWPETLELLPHLAAQTWQLEPDGKLMVSYADLMRAHGWNEEPRMAKLGGIALLEQAQESGWEDLNPVEAVGALWECVGVPLSSASRNAASAWISDAVRQVPLYRLRVGTGPMPDPPPGF